MILPVKLAKPFDSAIRHMSKRKRLNRGSIGEALGGAKLKEIMAFAKASEAELQATTRKSRVTSHHNIMPAMAVRLYNEARGSFALMKRVIRKRGKCSKDALLNSVRNDTQVFGKGATVSLELPSLTVPKNGNRWPKWDNA